MMVDPETTVLIADDDVSFATFARTALAGIGATAQTVGDGDACLEAVRASQPDAILLDLFMPGIDGLEVLRRVRAAPALLETICIALSANAMAEDMARARIAGFADYWTKPIAFEHFLAQLDALIERRHPTQRARRAH